MAAAIWIWKFKSEVNAKVKLAKLIDGVKPQINNDNQDTYLKEAYHPILYVKNVRVVLYLFCNVK